MYGQIILRSIMDEAQRKQQAACAGGYGLVSWTGAPLSDGPFATEEEALVAGKALSNKLRIPVYVKSFRYGEQFKIHTRC